LFSVTWLPAIILGVAAVALTATNNRPTIVSVIIFNFKVDSPLADTCHVPFLKEGVSNSVMAGELSVLANYWGNVFALYGVCIDGVVALQ